MQTQLDPLAKHLVRSYFETWAFSASFEDDYDFAPNTLLKAHFLRNATQAAIFKDDRFVLGSAYADFGRVEASEVATGESFLFRSASATRIEREKVDRELRLFELPSVRHVDTAATLLVYEFKKDGLDLSVAGTVQRVGSRRLLAAAVPTFIATWPYAWNEPDGEPFNQEGENPWEDLGHVRDEDQEEGEEGAQ